MDSLFLLRGKERDVRLMGVAGKMGIIEDSGGGFAVVYRLRCGYGFGAGGSKVNFIIVAAPEWAPVGFGLTKMSLWLR